MKILQAIVASLVVGEAWAWKHSSESELKKQLGKNEYTLIAFVAPQTTACKDLESEWTRVSQTEKQVLSIDCTSLPSLCAEMDVASYPAIRLYQRSGRMIRYRGPRRVSSITAFARRVRRPPLADLTEQSTASFSIIDDIVFVAQFHSPDDEKLIEQFSGAAEEYRDRFSFGLGEAAKGAGGIRCYNNEDDFQHVITATELDQRVGALADFVRICTRPAIPLLTRRNEMTYLQSGKSLVYFFSDNAEDRDQYTALLKPLAKTYQEYLQLVTVDSVEYADMPRNLGLSTKRGLSIQNPHNGQVFPYRGSIEPDAIAKFILDISGGKVQPWNGQFEESVEASHDEL